MSLENLETEPLLNAREAINNEIMKRSMNEEANKEVANEDTEMTNLDTSVADFSVFQEMNAMRMRGMNSPIHDQEIEM